MSKKNSLPENIAVPEGGSAFRSWDFQHLEGRLLTFIEALGFSAAQEKAVKDVVKDALYEFVGKTMYLTGEQWVKAYNENNSLGQNIPHN